MAPTTPGRPDYPVHSKPMLSPAWARETVAKGFQRLMLVEAEQRAASRSPSQQADIAQYYEAGTRRYLAAEALTEPADAVGALILYRDGIRLLVAALVKAEDESADVPSTAASALDLVNGLSPVPHPVSDAFARTRSGFGADDPLALDALSPIELQKLRSAAQQTTAWLRTRIDPRPARAIRAMGRVRLALFAVLAAALLIFLGSRVMAPRNIARGKVTTASSRHPGTPLASGATNGEIEANYGVHTEGDPDGAWLMVDLGRLYTVHEVRVYNRGDGWQDEGVPVDLQLSVDGRSWIQIERRTTVYTQSQPWVVKVHTAPVRYVRLKRPPHGVIAISEIEVY